jgi:hypothetical protein
MSTDQAAQRATTIQRKPFKGWTLVEAIERTVDRSVVQEWERAEKEQRQFGKPGGGLISAGLSADPEAIAAAARYRECRDKKADASRRLLMARKKVEAELVQHLKEHKLLATGRKGSPVADPTILPPSAWDCLSVSDYRRSILIEQTRAKQQIFDVRLYPLVHAPEVATHLAGLSLSETFRKCVLDDPEIGILAQTVIREEGYAAVFQNGQYPGPFVAFHWPLDVNAKQLASQFVRQIVIALDAPLRKPSDRIERVSQVLADRWLALVGLLVGGQLAAHGEFAATGAANLIDRFQWTRKGLSVEILNGDLCEEKGYKPVTRWRGLWLETPGQSAAGASEGGGASSRAEVRSRGGAPPKYAWDSAIDRLVLRMAKDGMPDSKAELISWVQELAAVGDQMPDESTVREVLQKRLPETYHKSGSE